MLVLLPVLGHSSPEALWVSDNLRALIIRIGFWVQYSINIVRNPSKNVGNYLGFFIKRPVLLLLKRSLLPVPVLLLPALLLSPLWLLVAVLSWGTSYPEGHTTIVELGPKRPSPLWFLEPNSTIVVYMDPLGHKGSCKGAKMGLWGGAFTDPIRGSRRVL